MRKSDKPGTPATVPKPSRGERRSLDILRTASELFLERGYDQTSVDEIIQRSGGSKTHVYSKFQGKEGLFLACIEFLCDEVQTHIATVEMSHVSAEAGLRSMAQALVKTLLSERHIAFQRLVYAESSRFPRVGELWFQRGPQQTVHILRSAMEQWMERGELRSGDAGLLASLFCDLLAGHILDRAWLGLAKRPSANEKAQIVETALQLFLHGVAAR